MTSPTCPTLLWHRVQRSIYALTLNGVVVATIYKTSESWLSYIDRPDEDGWHAVDFSTLAQAKAAMLRWWHERPRPVSLRHHDAARFQAVLSLASFLR